MLSPANMQKGECDSPPDPPHATRHTPPRVRLGSGLPTSGDGLLLNERLLYFGQNINQGTVLG